MTITSTFFSLPVCHIAVQIDNLRLWTQFVQDSIALVIENFNLMMFCILPLKLWQIQLYVACLTMKKLWYQNLTLVLLERQTVKGDDRDIYWFGGEMLQIRHWVKSWNGKVDQRISICTRRYETRQNLRHWYSISPTCHE